jgi:hypothetical protein
MGISMEKLRCHETTLKVHVDPVGNTVMMRSAELSNAITPKAPT